MTSFPHRAPHPHRNMFATYLVVTLSRMLMTVSGTAESAVGVKDRASKRVRAKVTEKPDATTLQAFVVEQTAPDAMVYTDEISPLGSAPSLLSLILPPDDKKPGCQPRLLALPASVRAIR